MDTAFPALPERTAWNAQRVAPFAFLRCSDRYYFEFGITRIMPKK